MKQHFQKQVIAFSKHRKRGHVWSNWYPDSWNLKNDFPTHHAIGTIVKSSIFDPGLVCSNESSWNTYQSLGATFHVILVRELQAPSQRNTFQPFLWASHTCCHSSTCQTGGQSIWLQACKECGFLSLQSSSAAADPPGCRQNTSRVWIPTPHVAEQRRQGPLCQLFQQHGPKATF